MVPTTVMETTLVAQVTTGEVNRHPTVTVITPTDMKVTRHGVLVVTDLSIVTVVPLVAKVLLWSMSIMVDHLLLIPLTAQLKRLLPLLLKKLREEILVHLMVFTGSPWMVVAPDKSIA